MTNIPEKLVSMIKEVASAIGNDMLSEVAFVGGCTTGLLMTDPIVKETVRYTQDVDLILNVIGYPAWARLQENLREIGFTDSMTDDAPICRMNLGDLQVDFMPIDPDILGFSNKWYKEALETSEQYKLDDEITIRLLTPPFFIATKFEAYIGRGNNDPIGSNDVEDILNLFDGREELVTEIKLSPKKIRSYIAKELTSLQKNEYFQYTVASITRNSPGRDKILYERIAAVCEMQLIA